MLLDSWTWIEFFKGSQEGERVQKILEKDECFTSIISISEITNWCLRNDLDPGFIVRKVMDLSKIINLSEEIAELAGRINFENKMKIKN